MISRETLRAARVVLRKELTDGLRDRRTLMMALLFPLLGPMTLAVALDFAAQSMQRVAREGITLPVAGREHAPNLVAFLEGEARIVPPPADPAERVRKAAGQITDARTLLAQLERETDPRVGARGRRRAFAAFFGAIVLMVGLLALSRATRPQLRPRSRSTRPPPPPPATEAAARAAPATSSPTASRTSSGTTGAPT